MATNTFKLGEGSKSGRESMFSFLERAVRLDSIFKDGLPIRIIPRILFITAIGIFYIGNRHFAEKTIRKINTLETNVEDLRADFTTLKADYMFESKQSEVAKKTKKLGLAPLSKPPYKITVARE